MTLSGAYALSAWLCPLSSFGANTPAFGQIQVMPLDGKSLTSSNRHTAAIMTAADTPNNAVSREGKVAH